MSNPGRRSVGNNNGASYGRGRCNVGRSHPQDEPHSSGGADPAKRTWIGSSSDSSGLGFRGYGGNGGNGDRDRDRERGGRSGQPHVNDNGGRNRGHSGQSSSSQGGNAGRERHSLDSPGNSGNRGGRGRGQDGSRGRGRGKNEDIEVDDEERRGARRGQRIDRNDRFDLVASRPETMVGEGSKRGSSGQQVNLIANFFPLIKQATWSLYNYRVDFKPDEERTPVKKALLRGHAHSLGGDYMCDGSTMWTAHRLSPDPMILYSMRESDKEKIELTIRLVAEMQPGDVTYLQFYNIIVRKCLTALQFDELGRHFYDREAAISIPHHRLELWPGFITSLRNFENQLMLCVDITHKVLRLETCLSVITGHRGGYNSLRAAVGEELIGSIVMTHYNRRTYRIDDIDWETTPMSTFELKGANVSYQQYYKQKYQLDITDLRQPMLVSRPKKKDIHRGQTGLILLVPELCQMTGLSDQIRSNFTVMRELAQHLQQPPNRRFEKIQNFMRRIKGSPEISKELTNWGLQFSTTLVPVQGRVLPKENILMMSGGNMEDVSPDDHADWTYAFRKSNMFSSAHLNSWVILVSQRDANNVDNLIRTMQIVGRTLGFMVKQPLEIFRLPDTRIQTYISAINQAMGNHRGSINMIFAILPSNKLDLYAGIKKRCCLDFGIPSQCFQGKQFLKKGGLMSIVTKVVVQINAKLGGEPWATRNPIKSAMIVGFDVHHCGKRKGASVGAMVATTNKDLSKYYSTVSFSNNRDEISENMSTDLTKCLYAYKEVNENVLPSRIIMYRDGVGDGQLSHVFNIELAQIKKAISDLYTSAEKPLPMLSLIVVTKKINSKVTKMENGDFRSARNPSPGTVVDDVITLPERFDFFLISQHANQGTVSPTSYNVIFDQQGLGPDKLQRFTYKMTHLYYNWSGTVAVPAPCQYAHKLAYLTGLALGAPCHERLSHLLYYL